MIRPEGCASPSATSRRSRASTSTYDGARRSGSSAPTAPASPRTMRMIAAVSPGQRRRAADPRHGPGRATGRPSVAGSGSARRRTRSTTSSTSATTSTSTAATSASPRPRSTSRVDELLEFVSLTEKAKAKVEDLSGGMKRRLTIARSLVNRPDLLLLDEPTTGLDPQARHVLWDKLFRLKQAGVTLVITTHYMDEAEQLCDRLVVMDKGLIVAEGSPLALIREHSTREVAELRFGVAGEGDSHDALAEKVADLGDRVEVLPDRLLVYSHDGEEVIAKVHERGLAAGRRPGAALHAGGRLPPPHRPDAGRLMSTVEDRRPPGRAADRRGHRPPVRLLVDRLQAHLARRRSSARSWRRSSTSWRWACCSAASSRATPTSSRAPPPTSPSSCPGLVAAHAMQTAVGETTYPVMGADQVAAGSTTRCSRRRSQVRRPRRRPPALRRLPARHHLRRSSCWCSPRSASSRPGGGRCWPSSSQVLVGMAFAGLVYGFTARLRSEEGFGVLFRLGVFPLFLFSGAFFPIDNLGDVGAWVAPAHPAVARRQPVADVLHRQRRLVAGRGQRRACCSSLIVVGWFWSVAGLAKRLVS